MAKVAKFSMNGASSSKLRWHNTAACDQDQKSSQRQPSKQAELHSGLLSTVKKLDIQKLDAVPWHGKQSSGLGVFADSTFPVPSGHTWQA